jgi:nitroreductase
MSSKTAIALDDAIRQRRSVRGYLPDAVPTDVLRQIFELAQWAPSNCNVQPWQVYVASGETRNELKQRFMDGIANGKPMTPDIGFLPSLSGEHRTRQVECAQALYGAMGIARDDKMGRMRATMRNFELFDAPHVCFLGMDKSFGTLMALDVGMYAQTLMLAMTAHGVSSCAQGSMGYYPNDVREVFGVDDNIAILFGISFGYEDTTVAANAARTDRAPLSESVIFCN